MNRLLNIKSVHIIYILLPLYLIYSGFLISGINEDCPTALKSNNIYPYLADKPITEDGYYMLTVAWNIALGKGFTYNYNIPTSGVQPLATIIYSVIAKVCIQTGFEKTSFIKGVLIFSSLLLIPLWLLLNYLVGLLYPKGQRQNRLLITLLLSLFNIKLMFIFMNGLETGLYLVLIFCSVIASIKYFELKKRSTFNSMALAIVFGVTLLARIDFAMIIIVLITILFLLRKIKLIEGVLLLIIPFMMLLPWLIYSHLATGSWIQSSVNAQSSILKGISIEDVLWFLSAIIHPFIPFVATSSKYIVIPLSVPMLVASIYWLTKKKIIYNILSDSINKQLLIVWIIAIFSLSITYLLFSTANYFYLRYFAPVYVTSLPLLVTMIIYIYERISKLNVLVFVMTVPVIFFIQSIFYIHLGKLSVTQSLRINFIKTNFKDDTRIGTWQSGVTGFYCSNVFNLDGKIDREALQYSSSKEIEKFIDKKNIEVLIEWKEAFENLDKEYLKANWTLYSNDIGDKKSLCYIRRICNTYR